MLLCNDCLNEQDDLCIECLEKKRNGYDVESEMKELQKILERMDAMNQQVLTEQELQCYQDAYLDEIGQLEELEQEQQEEIEDLVGQIKLLEEQDRSRWLQIQQTLVDNEVLMKEYDGLQNKIIQTSIDQDVVEGVFKYSFKTSPKKIDLMGDTYDIKIEESRVYMNNRIVYKNVLQSMDLEQFNQTLGDICAMVRFFMNKFSYDMKVIGDIECNGCQPNIILNNKSINLYMIQAKDKQFNEAFNLLLKELDQFISYLKQTPILKNIKKDLVFNFNEIKVKPNNEQLRYILKVLKQICIINTLFDSEVEQQELQSI